MFNKRSEIIRIRLVINPAKGKINDVRLADIIHTKKIVFTFCRLYEPAIETIPAFLYSSRYLMFKTRKCGICQRNINIEKQIIEREKCVSPLANHPIKGGIAPTRPPGSKAK